MHCLTLALAFFTGCGNGKKMQTQENTATAAVAVQDSPANDRKPQKAMQGEKTLVIQGTFDSAGTRLLNIRQPVVYNRKLLRPTPDQPNGKFEANVQYASGDSVRIPFDALVAGDRQGQEAMHGFFELQIPVKEEPIQQVKIVETRSQKKLALFRKEDILHQ